jgi:probable phosphoglycerate mutase
MAWSRGGAGTTGRQIVREAVNAAPGDPARLYFVRHGETEWSLSGRHTGRTDIPLTTPGEDGARRLGPWLKEPAFAHVLTSPRLRARRTCELSGLGPNAAIDPDLAEWDYGDYEGLRSAEIERDRPGWSIFRDGCPGGESPRDVADRADRLIARLRATGGAIALFSHGHFGGALAARWIRLPVAIGRNFALSPASLSILSHGARHPDVPVIELWNGVPGFQ